MSNFDCFCFLSYIISNTIWLLCVWRVGRELKKNDVRLLTFANKYTHWSLTSHYVSVCDSLLLIVTGMCGMWRRKLRVMKSDEKCRSYLTRGLAVWGNVKRLTSKWNRLGIVHVFCSIREISFLPVACQEFIYSFFTRDIKLCF